jgi:hypothetical protein
VTLAVILPARNRLLTNFYCRNRLLLYCGKIAKDYGLKHISIKFWDYHSGKEVDRGLQSCDTGGYHLFERMYCLHLQGSLKYYFFYNFSFYIKMGHFSHLYYTFQTCAMFILFFYRQDVSTGNWGGSVTIVFDYRLDYRGSIPDRGKGFFSLASVSRPGLRPTQPLIQLVPGVLSRG